MKTLAISTKKTFLILGKIRFIIVASIFSYSLMTKVHAQEFKNEFEVGTSNDFFILSTKSDRYYTYGAHLDYRRKKENTNFLDKLFPNSEASYYNIGFSMEAYTPGYIKGQTDLDERPYAGWSYFKYQNGFSYANKSLKVGVDVGILGPHSYAGNIQNWFHREISGDRELEGWENQIGDILGINLRLEYAKTFKTGKSYDLSFVLDNSLGNIFIYTEPAVLLRLGKFNNIGNSVSLNNAILSKTDKNEFFMELAARLKLSAFNATIQDNIFENNSIFTQDEINNAIFNAVGGINYSKRNWMIRARYYYSMGEIHSNENHFYATFSAAYRW